MSNVITKELFATWLDMKADDEIVGYAGANTECPIAKFFMDYSEINYASVGGGMLRYKSGGYTMFEVLPLWAKELERCVDDESEQGAGVTVTEMREWLEYV